MLPKRSSLRSAPIEPKGATPFALFGSFLLTTPVFKQAVEKKGGFDGLWIFPMGSGSKRARGNAQNNSQEDTFCMKEEDLQELFF